MHIRPIVIVIALLAASALFAGAVAADTIELETAAVSFQEIDGARIATFLDMTAWSGDFTVVGPTARYSETTEEMVVSGSGNVRASLTKAGENPFEVSARDEIAIDFQSETLSALGNVVFRSDDIDARSEALAVNQKSVLQAQIDALLASLPQGPARQLVLDFLAKVADDDRLILLRGDVQVVREDSSMEASWMLVNEANQSELISVADPERRIRLTITRAEDEAENGDTQD